MSTLAIHGGEPIRTKKFPAYRVIDEQEKKEVNRVLDSGILSRYLGCWHEDFYGGPEVQAFEKEWAEYFGVKHALAVNSCTSGLIAAVGALGIGPGDEVIVPPYTMCASVTAALWYGAIPVFADVEPNYFCIDPDSVAQRITKHTKAIIAVDLLGQPYDAGRLNEIAKKYNIPVIEDCAQAPGALYHNRFAGTLADVGIYSFNYHKHIHTGEGGMVVTNDDRIAERVQLIRNHAEAVVEGKEVEDITNMVGFNFRLTELQAAIGRVQLKKLASLVEARVQNCRYLAKGLSVFPGISDPGVRPDATHVYYQQALLYKEEEVGIPRNTFIEAVAAELPVTELRETEGTKLEYGYCRPLYLLPLFQKRMAIGSQGFPFTLAADRGISYEKGLCPVVERLHEKELFTNEFMRPPASQEDLDDVARAFQKVYEHKDELK